MSSSPKRQEVPPRHRYERAKRRRLGLPNFRLVRYADDWCLMIFGTKAHAEAMREEIAEVLSTMGFRLSEEKTLITHIETGLDFLGWHIQRRRKRGTTHHYVYTYPAKKALLAVMAKVKTLCRQVGTDQSLDALLLRLNRALRGWCAYFRPGVSYATFAYLIASPRPGRRSLNGMPNRAIGGVGRTSRPLRTAPE